MHESNGYPEICIQNGHGRGTLASVTGLTAVTHGCGPHYRTVLTLTDVQLPITDSGANGGHGSLTLFTFPEGHINITSSHALITQFSANGSNMESGVVDIGIGTTATATDNEELATTEQDIVAKVETTLNGSGDLSASVGGTVKTDTGVLDGSSSAKIVRLNAAVTAGTISATDTVTTDEQIVINWTLVADD